MIIATTERVADDAAQDQMKSAARCCAQTAIVSRQKMRANEERSAVLCARRALDAYANMQHAVDEAPSAQHARVPRCKSDSARRRRNRVMMRVDASHFSDTSPI